MSGQSAGGLIGMVVGGAVGLYFGQPLLGITIGGTLGGLAGGFYDTQTTPDSVNEQPSLANVTIETSAFGQVIPQVFGTIGNLAGNVIWATRKVEHQHRDEQSAKGGGPKQVSITKTYTQSLALGLCDTRLTGPITGLHKVYRDLKLIFDASDAGPGAIATFDIDAGGTGYLVGDIGGVAGGGLNANYRVEAVSGGAITDLVLVTHGTGYAVASSVALHRGSGIGNDAQINITSVVENGLPSNFTFYPGSSTQLEDPLIQSEFEGNGTIVTFSISAAGSGYVVGGTGGVAGGNFDAGYTIDTIDGGGGITALHLTAAGTGYSVASGVHLHRNTLTTGDDAAINILSVTSTTQVPAYRYLCYVVIEDDDLGRSGRTYNYTFEVYQDPTPTLSEVVTTLCAAAGLTEDEIDVDAIPTAPTYDDVHMNLVTMQEVRAPLQALTQAYRFYAVESGTKLAFREIGTGAIVAEIPESATDAHEGPGEGKGLVVSRNDQVDLPTELNVTYVDAEQHYLSNTQRAILAAPSGALDAPRTLSTPLVLPASQARRLAQEALNEVWIQREVFTTTLSRAYAYLEPGDRLTITARDLTYTAVITDLAYGKPGLVELTARLDAAFVVNAPVADPGTVLPADDPVWYVGDTLGILLNIPALAASDQAPRYHIAYLGMDTSLWPGASLYRSVDAEATYQLLDASLMQAITGTVDDAIDDADWHVIDNVTTFTVVLNYGTLASVSDLALYNGQNLALLGSEVIGFGTATLLDELTYELSHLLRGRRGTEWATGTHTDFERFTLIDAAVRPLSLAIADRYAERPYKTPTLGQTLADVEQSPFTPTGENVVPWSNCQEAATRPASDWVLTWRYRAAFAGDWVDYVGVNYDPGFTGYQVTIYSDNTFATVKRTITTDGGSPLTADALMTETYSLADQTTDFGGIQSTLYWTVASLTTYGAGRVNAITSTP